MVEDRNSDVGRRVLMEGSFGTIRFYGQVPEGSGKFWYGIEWDDAERGKHSGVANGIAYFKCQ
jgi:tubulin-specific chaperone E